MLANNQAYSLGQWIPEVQQETQAVHIPSGANTRQSYDETFRGQERGALLVVIGRRRCVQSLDRIPMMPLKSNASASVMNPDLSARHV